MAKKIVLDAGHALGLAGNKTPDGIDEWTLNNKVALAVTKNLADYEVTVSRVDDITGKIDVPLCERVSRVNKIMPDALVSIHHNAYMSKWGNHTGVEAFYNLNRKNDIEKTLAGEVSANISANTGLRNRGAKTAAFTMLTVDSKILAILTEGGFMDSIIDHPVITSEKGQEAYAKAISDGLIKQLKLVKKPKDPTDVKVGDKYVLKNSTPGYYTAADALADRDVRVTVLAGDYWVYSVASGMINISKSKTTPGSWINPNQSPIVGGKYILKGNMPGYYTAADAKARRHQRVTVLAGDYIVFKLSDGMVNVTKVKGQPGSWINPN